VLAKLRSTPFSQEVICGGVYEESGQGEERSHTFSLIIDCELVEGIHDGDYSWTGVGVIWRQI
jgi:hypothetical protein